ALRLVRGGRTNDPSRSRGPARRGIAERVLAVVARTGKGSVPDARGAGDRLRAVQPARKGVSDWNNRRDDDVRQHRLSQHRPALHPGEPPGEPRVRRLAHQVCREEEWDTRADGARVAAGTEALDRADPGYDQASSSRGESRRDRHTAGT